MATMGNSFGDTSNTIGTILTHIQYAREHLARIEASSDARQQRHENVFNELRNGQTRFIEKIEQLEKQVTKLESRVGDMSKTINELSIKQTEGTMLAKFDKLDTTTKLKYLAYALGIGAMGGGVASYKEVLAFIKTLF